MNNLNIKRASLLILTMLCCGIGLKAQVSTHWIHGWRDNAGVWQHYGPRLQQQRQMQSLTPEYSPRQSNSGVRNARIGITNDIDRNTENILIGHSMGGLVARDFERAFGANRTRGVVTVATPNQGAQVANNILNGSAQSIINEGVHDMQAGPVAEGKHIISGLITSIANLPGHIAYRIYHKKIDEFVQEDLFLEVNKLIEGFTSASATLEDFSVGGNYITGLNNRNPRVPVANIVCEENDKAALRLANAAISPPEEEPLNSYDDTGYIETADKLRQVYKAFRLYHDTKKFANPFRYKHHNVLANKWHTGEDYLDHVFEADYNVLIGATRNMPTTKVVRVRVCDTDCLVGGLLSRVEPCEPPEPQDCGYEYRTINTFEVRTEPSDGLLHITTQEMPDIPNGDVYTAKGVNHLEVGNHPNIEQQYNRVFNRPGPLGVETRN